MGLSLGLPKAHCATGAVSWVQRQSMSEQQSSLEVAGGFGETHCKQHVQASRKGSPTCP